MSMFGILDGLLGGLSRADKVLYTRLREQAGKENRAMSNIVRELIQNYLEGVPSSPAQNPSPSPSESFQKETLQKERRETTPVASTSSLQSELEKTKAVLSAAFELSDMLRPQQGAEGGESIGDLMDFFKLMQPQQNTQPDDVIERALKQKKAAVAS